jgi:O-antigen/teichoic acid export membrane protein
MRATDPQGNVLNSSGDVSLAQVGFFSIASQFRNMVGMAPGLLTEGSLAIMADPEGETQRAPHQILGFVTFTSLLVSFLMAATAILLLPRLLRTFYSRTYSHAAPAVAIALALAVMHMGNAPASARLSIVCVRSSIAINAIWAIVVIGAGVLLLTRGMSAAMAMLIFLGAHSLSSVLVLFMLWRKDSLPRGMTGCFVLATCAAAALAAVAAFRDWHPDHASQFNVGIALASLATLACLIAAGRHCRWFPRWSTWIRVICYIGSPLQRWPKRQSHAV